MGGLAAAAESRVPGKQERKKVQQILLRPSDIPVGRPN